MSLTDNDPRQDDGEGGGSALDGLSEADLDEPERHQPQEDGCEPVTSHLNQQSKGPQCQL